MQASLASGLGVLVLGPTPVARFYPAQIQPRHPGNSSPPGRRRFGDVYAADYPRGYALAESPYRADTAGWISIISERPTRKAYLLAAGASFRGTGRVNSTPCPWLTPLRSPKGHKVCSMTLRCL
jgi:hypothetical protein